MRCGALLLAAGQSSRMGARHKLLENWRGKPLVAHAVDALLAAGLPVLVVTGHRASDVRAALAGQPVQFVDADDYADGLSHSLRAGLEAAPEDWEAVLVALGDMPLLEPELLVRLAAADGVAVPVFEGRRGNPVRWPKEYWPRLMALRGDAGARGLLVAIAACEVAAPSGSIFADIDTVAALDALREQ